MLNLNGHAISAVDILLGWEGDQPVTLNRGGAGGTLHAQELLVGNCSFDLPATDKVGAFDLNNATSTLHTNVPDLFAENGSTVTTTAGGSATHTVGIQSGSTLNLGADLASSNFIEFRYADTTFNLNGHAVTSNLIFLGWYDNEPVTINRGGPGGTFHALELFVANNSFDVLANDQVQDFYLHSATSTLGSNISSLQMENGSAVTTTSVGTIVNSVDIASSSVLNLGADLSILFSPLTVIDAGSSINANGFNVNAFSVTLGVGGSGAVAVNDVGTLTARSVSLDQGSSMTVHGGVINNLLSLQNGSTLTVLATNGFGLTLNGATADSLVIDPSVMNLVFNTTGWGFRWLDPNDGSGSNWVSTLEAMIAANQIQLGATVAGTFSVYDQGGYTYIGYTAAPEPASFALAGLGGLVVAGSAVKSRRRLRAKA